MRENRTVTVYSFQTVGFWPQMVKSPDFKATRETILLKFQGEVLEGTGQEVALTELDAEGRYRRVATGWGELR